jgi:uncharacterized protein DUF6883
VKLPNGEHAIVEDRKVIEYMLNPLHPVGGPKAHLFNTLLGFNASNWQVLRDSLVRAAKDEEAIEGRASPFGQKYELRFQMTGKRRSYTILSIWIIPVGESNPRLVTAYIE